MAGRLRSFNTVFDCEALANTMQKMVTEKKKSGNLS